MTNPEELSTKAMSAPRRFARMALVVLLILVSALIGSRAFAQSIESRQVGLWSVNCATSPSLCFAMLRSPGDNSEYATISLFASSSQSVKVKITVKPIWGVTEFAVSFGKAAPVSMICESTDTYSCTLSQADSDRFIDALATSHVITLHAIEDYTLFSNGFALMAAAFTEAVEQRGHPDFQMSWPASDADQALPATGAWCQTPIGGCKISPAPMDGDCLCPSPAGRVRGWVKQAG